MTLKLEKMPSLPTNDNPRSCIREGCNEVFIPKWKNHQCCSRRCASKLGAAVMRARSKKIHKKCALEGCNGIVECWPCTQHIRKFCSRACYSIAKSFPRIEREPRTCERAGCDEVFYIRPKNKKRFCSNRCVNLHNTHPEVLRICLNCGTYFNPSLPEGVYCSRQCASDARWSDPIWSKKQCERISIASKNRWKDSDYKANMIEMLKLPKSDEHKAALSRARTGFKMSPESRAKIAEIQRRPEVRAKKSAASRRVWQDPNFRNLWHSVIDSPQYKDKIALINSNPKSRAKKSAAMRRRWQDPDYRKNQVKHLTSMCQMIGMKRSVAVGIMESLGLEDLLITTTEKVVQLTVKNPSDNASKRYNFRKGYVALRMIKEMDPTIEHVMEAHIRKITRQENQNA